MDEEQENQNEEENESQQESIKSPGGARGLLNKSKSAGKKAIKKGADVVKKGIKQIWKALPVTAKLWVIGIVAFVIFIALVIVIMGASAMESSPETSQAYYDSLLVQTEESKFYKETGSYLFSTQHSIAQMAQLYYKQLRNSNEELRSYMMRQYGTPTSLFGQEDLVDRDAVSADEGRDLYEHILGAEKYNFNKIVWRELDRGEVNLNSDGTFKEPTMKVDFETQLRFPDDELGTTLKGFANMVRPYLQTWVIPYAMVVGIYNDGTMEDLTKNIGYQLILNAYHDITIDKHKMEKLTTVTKQNIYDEKNVQVSVTVTCTAEGFVGPLMPGQFAPLVCTESKPVETVISETPCKQDVATITKQKDKEYRYYTKNIKTFDSVINYEYDYTKYSEASEPDEIGIIRSEYSAKEGQTYPIVNKYMPGTYTSNYIVKDGYTETTTRVYKDKIDQRSYEKRSYKVSDIEEYISPSVLDSNEKLYYDQYEQEKLLNKYDIINAKKDIYSKYIKKGEEYSKNIGYHRDFVVFGLSALASKMTEVQDEYKDSFAYGSSLGVKETTNTNAPGIDVNSAESIDYSSIPEGGFVWPVPGVSFISSEYSMARTITVDGVTKTAAHQAIDIASPNKPAILASQAGTVIVSQWANINNPKQGLGQHVKVQHANGYVTVYGHMSKLNVKVGDVVKRGDALGIMGSTGYSTGDHLHFEVIKNGVRQNPRKYVNYENTGATEISELQIAENYVGGEAVQIQNVTEEISELTEEEETGQNINSNENYRKYVNEAYFTGWQDTYVINAPKYIQSAVEMKISEADISGNGSCSTATAMIVTGLTGERKWGPWEIYDWGVKRGIITTSDGEYNTLPRRFINTEYGTKLKVVTKDSFYKLSESTRRNIIEALKSKAVVILAVGSSNPAFPSFSGDKYYTGVKHYIAITGIKDNTNDVYIDITGIKDNTNDVKVYVHDPGNKSKFSSAQDLNTIIKVMQNEPYYIISRQEGYNPKIESTLDPDIDATGAVTGRINTSDEIGPATTTGWCKDFKPINWSSVSTVDTSLNDGSSSTSGPPTPGNSTGVLAAMQDFYRDGGLQGRTDYGGYTWDKVPFYSSNAQYALDNHKDTITRIAPDYGVDPLHVMSKMAFESGGGRSSGYGSGAAAGPMQIQKSVHLNNSISAYNVNTSKTDTIVMTREALSDTETNIRIGIMMYANSLKLTGGNPFMAAQKYNMGNIGYVTTYAGRVGKNKESVMRDYTDVGWLFDVMKYHNDQCIKTGARWGDGYYAYKFAMYLDWLQQKLK